MLVLTRRSDQELVFPASATRVRVLGIKRGAVRLGIEAPPDVPVLRGELPDRAAQWTPAGAPPPRAAGPVPRFGLADVAAGLGLVQLQLDAALTEDARTTLAAVREGLRRLRAGPGPAPAPPPDRARRALPAEGSRPVEPVGPVRGPAQAPDVVPCGA